MRFADRRQAGAELGELVAREAPTDPVVYALPRGGVPVGIEVASRLGCPLDIVAVRKLGVPGQPELAMGALAEGGVLYRDGALIAMAGVSEAAFAEVVSAETARLATQAALRPPGSRRVPAAGRTALVVDDGLATGATALAATRALREMGASSVWVCVPVGPADPPALLENEADRLLIAYQPRRFQAVGLWYQDFAPVADEEVRSILLDAGLRFRSPTEES